MASARGRWLVASACGVSPAALMWQTEREPPTVLQRGDFRARRFSPHLNVVRVHENLVGGLDATTKRCFADR